jgi:hypothetical protein
VRHSHLDAFAMLVGHLRWLSRLAAKCNASCGPSFGALEKGGRGLLDWSNCETG